MNFMSRKASPIASEQEIQELLNKARGRNSERSVRDQLTNSLKVNFHIDYQQKIGEERRAWKILFYWQHLPASSQ